jgi:NAD(P)-dependent dehydrogenase (short-subunit alcohol dehydrogenase family)
MELKPIQDQVVVIVGATSGIGMNTAIEFGKRGARVVLAGRSEADLRNVLTRIRENGGDGITVTADVSNWEQVKGIADQALGTYYRIDTWVNLAAVSIWGAFSTITPEEFKRIIDVNFMGQVYGAMAALPIIRQQNKGSIIFVSSVEARVPLPLHSAYAASKHAIDGFVRSLRMELDHAMIPINITSIMPSSINTPFFAKAKTNLGVKPRPFPPVYESGPVSSAILYAAEHPVREIVVGGAGFLMQIIERISPRLTDAFLQRTGFDFQETSEIKPSDAPSSLFEHLPGFNQVQGEFDREARSFSLETWLATHPAARVGITTAALGAASYLAVRSVIRSRLPGK